MSKEQHPRWPEVCERMGWWKTSEQCDGGKRAHWANGWTCECGQTVAICWDTGRRGDQIARATHNHDIPCPAQTDERLWQALEAVMAIMLRSDPTLSSLAIVDNEMCNEDCSPNGKPLATAVIDVFLALPKEGKS